MPFPGPWHGVWFLMRTLLQRCCLFLLTPSNQQNPRTHAHAHTHTHARTHTYIRMHAHARTHICTYTRTHTHTHKHARRTHMHTYACTHTRMHAHTHTYKRTHARTRIHTHTRTHTYICERVADTLTTLFLVNMVRMSLRTSIQVFISSLFVITPDSWATTIGKRTERESGEQYLCQTTLLTP